MSFLPEVTQKSVNCHDRLSVVTCYERLRTTTSRTGERSGNDQKQNDGNLTKVTKNVLSEKILT